jgi:hypothetical protein
MLICKKISTGSNPKSKLAIKSYLGSCAQEAYCRILDFKIDVLVAVICYSEGMPPRCSEYCA